MQIIKIGKAESNEIYKDFKDDPTVSRVHCEIFVDDEGNKFLTDLNSTNGTFVNGNKISEPVQLGRFDIVRAGNSLVKWKEYLMDEDQAVYDVDETSVEYDNADDFSAENITPIKKKNYWWIVIVIVVLFFMIKQCNSTSDSSNYTPSTTEDIKAQEQIDDAVIKLNKLEIPKQDIIIYCPLPENGFSPYDEIFGKGIYNNNSGNKFTIKNTQSSHAVVLLVNAYSGKKIRNEFVRKGEQFTMTGVPNGTYYVRWVSGNDWCPDLEFGKLKGGFQTNMSFAETSDPDDWMTVGSLYESWTLTLYAVVGGDVQIQGLNKNEFFK